VLLRLARERPDLFDVGITSIDDTSPAIEKNLARVKSEFEGQLVPYEDFAESLGRFKYLVSVDGVTVAWRGRALLQAGGTLLLQNSAMGEHFYDDMIPWTHYVPIKQDLSDLVSTVEWLEAHPARAEEIAAAGFRFAQEKLTQDATYCYIKRLAAVVRNATAYELPSPDALIEYGFQQSPAQAQKRWRAR
jgi:hypothetical protein